MRPDLALGKITHRLLEETLLLAEAEIHVVALPKAGKKAWYPAPQPPASRRLGYFT
jgi:hypothetical protein